MRLRPGSTRPVIVLLLLMLCFAWSARYAGAAADPPASHTVLISGFKFQPDTLTVDAGDTVIWKNADIVPHTVTAGDKSFNSGSIAPGASWTLVTKTRGSFPYSCVPHPNMHAKLIVQ